MQDSAPRILAVGRALPSEPVEQARITAELKRLWGSAVDAARLEQMHRAVRVRTRSLALPLGEYAQVDSFARANQLACRVGIDLLERAARDALAQAGLTARDVNHVFFTTGTCIATPSLETALANRLGMRPDLKRTPLFGLGCVAGGAGLARAADYLRAYPRDVALLVSVELHSLTLQRSDTSITNVVATGLFGDGAAAVVLAGAERGGTGPIAVANRSVLFRNTEWVMGWDVVTSGLKVVLSHRVPELVREYIHPQVDAFLTSQGLTRRDIRHWVFHPGGPKVLEALQDTLGISREALEPSWGSLATVGNLSSASVLFILGDTLAARRTEPGDLGLLLAMGPGFGAELMLLRW